MPTPEDAPGRLLGISMITCMACLTVLACNVLTSAARPTPPPTPVVPSPAPTSGPTSPASTLATPVADSPAAGICAETDGPVVAFRIEPGIPDPRCSRARPDQQLKVTNNTDGPLEVSIGPFSGHMEPGDVFTVETPFGSYLAPGVHFLKILPCCGPEIILEQPSPP